MWRLGSKNRLSTESDHAAVNITFSEGNKLTLPVCLWVCLCIWTLRQFILWYIKSDIKCWLSRLDCGCWIVCPTNEAPHKLYQEDLSLCLFIPPLCFSPLLLLLISWCGCLLVQLTNQNLLRSYINQSYCSCQICSPLCSLSAVILVQNHYILIGSQHIVHLTATTNTAFPKSLSCWKTCINKTIRVSPSWFLKIC